MFRIVDKFSPDQGEWHGKLKTKVFKWDIKVTYRFSAFNAGHLLLGVFYSFWVSRVSPLPTVENLFILGDCGSHIIEILSLFYLPLPDRKGITKTYYKLING